MNNGAIRNETLIIECAKTESSYGMVMGYGLYDDGSVGLYYGHDEAAVGQSLGTIMPDNEDAHPTVMIRIYRQESIDALKHAVEWMEEHLR